jgi:hypothetical protein
MMRDFSDKDALCIAFAVVLAISPILIAFGAFLLEGRFW